LEAFYLGGVFMGLLGFLFGKKKDSDMDAERFYYEGKKSDEDVLIVPGRSSVYHLAIGCFTGSGMMECVRVSRKDAEASGYRLCKRCEKSIALFYEGDPFNLNFDK
jgi:hypothetical protein